jgi:murein DD-endopeptidase MepM/ murein hydrolase activator NlpD
VLQRRGALLETWRSLFHDHEIYVRTGGEVRFLLLSARLQRRVATIALALATAWLLGTLALLGWQAWTSWQTRDVEARQQAVAAAEARVAAERQSVEGIAKTLDARQDSIEALFRAHFGDDPAAAEALAVGGDAPAPDQVARLQQLGARQDQLVAAMTGAVARRVERAETALQTVGLKAGSSAQGGPFLPLPRAEAPATQDPALRQLVATIARMEQLESLLVALPSNLPTAGMQLSSGFGVRYDPFNGERAMHAGLDFKGAHGSPIRAAAPGRISFVGVKSGYGNVVEVDHGHGLLTRYAHLAGFSARIGQAVEAGQQIALMGSTGRSTGTHLHFEVRVNGVAVNPRPFLEANADVLEIKADAGSRARRLADG